MTRRIIHWRFIAVTSALSAALVLVLYFLHGWQVARTAQGLLSLVKEREQAGEWSTAAEHLDRYIRIHPEDAAAKVRLAKVYGKFATKPPQKNRAIELHYRALAAGDKAAESELRAGLADLLLETGRWIEAEREARLILKANENDPRGARALALSLSRQVADGSFVDKQASQLKLLESLDRARKVNPSDAKLPAIQAMVLREFPVVVEAERPDWPPARRAQEADACLDSLVALHPDSAEARLARFRYRAKYLPGDDDSDLDAALQLAPDDIEVLTTAAAYALAQGRRHSAAGANEEAVQAFEEAERHSARIVSLDAEDDENDYWHAHLGVGDARLGAGSFDGALAAWKIGLEAFSQPTVRLELYGRIADACLANDRLSDASDALDACESLLAKLGGTIVQEQRTPLRRAQDLRRTKWHLQRRSYSEALPLLRGIIASQAAGEAGVQSSFQAAYLLGTAHAALGEWPEAAAAYEQASSLQPTQAGIRLAAANAWLMSGRPDLALERAQQARAIAATPEAWFWVAVSELHVQRSRPPADRRWSRFDEAMAAVHQPAGSSTIVPAWRLAFVTAEAAAAREADSDLGAQRAAGVLRGAEDEFASDFEFLRQLCLFYQSLQQDQDADRILAQLKQQRQSDTETTIVEARLASQRDDDQTAVRLLQQTLKSAAPALIPRIRAELLKVAFAAKDWNQARALLMEDEQRDPNNLSVLRRLADLDLERSDLAGVEHWEGRIRQQGIAGQPIARYYRAWRLLRSAESAESPKLREALFELEQVLVAQPNWAEACALRGLTLHRLGRLEQAVADYERAVMYGDRRAFIFEQLISLLDRLDRPTDVDRHLARLEGAIPQSQWLTEFASAREVSRERPQRALELARKNVAQRPEDAGPQIWLGRLLVASNQGPEAEACFRRAIELAPDDTRAWGALLSYYGRSSDRSSIEAILARLKASTDLTAHRKSLLVGQAQQALGDLASAEKSFDQAASEDANGLATQLRVAQFHLLRAPARAKPHLEAALRIAPDSIPARQMMAIAEAATGNLPAAETLLSVVENGHAAAAENVRLHTLLLVQHGGPENLARAARMLEELVERKEGGLAVDRLLLARLYEQQAGLALDDAAAQKALNQTGKTLVELVESDQSNAIYIATLIQFLVRNSRAAEATKWLEALERHIEPKATTDANALAAVIESQLQMGQPGRAERWLAKLDEVEPTALRPAALRARIAVALDPKADVESIVEKRLATCLAAANSQQQRQQLFSAAGNIYRELSRMQAAERWFAKLISERPGEYAKAVEVLVAQRRLSDAILLCEQAAQSDESPQPALVLAAALVEGQASTVDFARAEPLLAKTLSRHDSDANLLYAIALIRILQNSNDDAIALLRRVLVVSPRNVPALNNLALLLSERAGDRKEALALIEEAIKVAGPAPGLLDTKGSILVYAGRSAEAIEPLISATRKADADPRHHFHLAVAYRDTGRDADAKRHMQIAMDRQLAAQVLTATDRDLLTKLLDELRMNNPVSATTVMR